MILEEAKKKKKKKFDSGYLAGLSSSEKAERKKELKRGEKTDTDDASAYEPSRFKTDFKKSGEPKDTKTSKWTRKFKDMYGEAYELDEELLGEDEIVDLDDIGILREFIEQALLVEKKKKNNVTKSLKNKAEKTGAPMGALRAIYNKGLAAWRTGHRPGASQHAWAMARVNSVLAGGPARKVDAAQWKQIQKHRGKKKKK